MILVMLGTNPYSFTRLVEAMDSIAQKDNADVFIQLGNTHTIPKYCKFEHFLDRDLLKNKIVKSEIIVSHGGFGSIRDALSCNKPVVAVPRRPEFGESQDYQEELVRELESSGMVSGVYDINRLYAAIEKAKKKKVVYQHDNKICGIINTYLQTFGLC